MDQVVNISANLINASLGAAAWTLKPILNIVGKANGESNHQQLVLQQTIYSLPPNMKKWISIAGLMGASAVAVGAYGAHVVYPRKEISDKRKAIFETANKYHFLHSLALIGVPFSRRANLTGSLFITGTVIFAGSCYLQAITDNSKMAKAAPYGGVILIFAWLSFALP